MSILHANFNLFKFVKKVTKYLTDSELKIILFFEFHQLASA